MSPPTTDLTNKTVLITGGTQGIGRAIAIRCFRAGARVAVTYAHNASHADTLAAELGHPAPERFLALQSDASSVASSAALVDRIVASPLGPAIDVLIPNAGVMTMRDLSSVTESDFDASFALNVKGPLFLAQAAAPHMGSNGGGRIIFLSTGVLRMTVVSPAYMLYAATKGAVDQMVRTLAKDPKLAQKGVTVNAVAPGPTATELFFKGKPEAMVEGIKGTSPFKRLGEPEEIAAAVEFLAGPASSWVSGQVIGTNGAMIV